MQDELNEESDPTKTINHRVREREREKVHQLQLKSDGSANVNCFLAAPDTATDTQVSE